MSVWPNELSDESESHEPVTSERCRGEQGTSAGDEDSIPPGATASAAWTFSGIAARPVPTIRDTPTAAVLLLMAAGSAGGPGGGSGAEGSTEVADFIITASLRKRAKGVLLRSTTMLLRS